MIVKNIPQMVSKYLHFRSIVSKMILCVSFNRSNIKYFFNQKSKLSAYAAIKNKQQSSQIQTNHKCEGCNSILQSESLHKYGYIDSQVFKNLLSERQQLIRQSYGGKMTDKDSKVLDFMHEIESELNVKIFDKQTQSMINLDNVSVLYRLQEKIDTYEEQQQLLKKNKKLRTEILCHRCYNLKHHNTIPQDLDVNLDDKFNEQSMLNKILKVHSGKVVLYVYVVDALDIFGTLRLNIINKLTANGLNNVNIIVVINKLDILNKKYVNYHLILKQVQNIIKANYQKFNIPVFMVSGKNRNGIDKIQEYVEKNKTRIQLIGLPNTGKTTLMNALLKNHKMTVSKYPGTTLQITRGKFKQKNSIYDMPGIHCKELMYSLISRPSQRALLAWHKLYSPGLLTHSAIIFGGKVEIEGVRIIIFGLGGASNSSNRWFLLHHKQFWEGLPALNELKIHRYEHDLTFIDGVAQDLQIAGYGFIAFRLCIANVKFTTKKLVFYLPQTVSFNFRNSVLVNSNIFHNSSALKNKFMLQRIQQKR